MKKPRKFLLETIFVILFSPTFAQLPIDSAGWTILTPSADSRIIYVSNSTGNDSWSGLAATWNGTDGPKKSIHAGFALLRNGKSDWLLLMKGDIWRDQLLTSVAGNTVWNGNSLCGRSSTERIVISSYGSSTQRPTIEWSNEQNIWNVRNVAIVGIHFYSYKKDPSQPEFDGVTDGYMRMLYANKNILLEDNHLEYAGIVVQSVDDINGQQRFDSVEIRRNIIEKAYSINSHSQGIYSSTKHPGYLLIEENVFDHNGWNEEFRFVLPAPDSNLTNWQSVTDGRFRIEINQQRYNIDGLNFSSATSMPDVATIIENAINAALGSINAIQFNWSANGHAFFLTTTNYPSNEYYQVLTYTGSIAGTDLDGAQWFNSAVQGAPEATVFNRSMYLSEGFGNTVVKNNIDANGASGGIQQRMGGIAEGNLILHSPLALSFGHPQNHGNIPFGGSIANNVVLGSRDISNGPRGFGIGVGSYSVTSPNTGPSLAQNININHNIVAHNKFGTGNLFGLYLEGSGAYTNVDMYENIVYNWARPVWPNPNDTRATALYVDVPTASVNTMVRNNHFQQPGGGFAASSAAAPSGVNLLNNSYFSTSPNPPTVWSTGWFQIGSSIATSQWISQMNDSNGFYQQIQYLDPNRNIDTYMSSLGQTATYDAFIQEALKQSKSNWRAEYTADKVNCYIRDGFKRAVAFTTSPDTTIICLRGSASLNINNINIPDYSISWNGGIASKNLNFNFNPSNAGTYEVVATIIDSSYNWLYCEPLTKKFIVIVNNCSGIEELKYNIVVSPNPARTSFTFNLNTEENEVLVSLHNIAGQLVYNKKYNPGGTLTDNIDVNNLSRGIYYLKVNAGKNNYIRKIVVQ